MKPKNHMFESGLEAAKWLKSIQRHFRKWEDNTQRTSNALALRCPYPFSIALPKHAKMVGLSTIEAKVAPSFFLKGKSEQVQTLASTLGFAEEVAVLAWYSREKKHFVIGYRMDNKKPRVQFESGFRDQDISNNKIAYAEFFEALRRKVQFVRRGLTFNLKPSDYLKIEYQVRGSNGGPEIIICDLKEEYPGEGLEQIVNLAKRKNWQISSTEIFASYPSPENSRGHPDQILAGLNQATLPIRTAKLELWVTIDSWAHLDVLAALAKLDIEKTGLDLEIVRLELPSGREGYVIAKPKKSGFGIGIHASAKEDEAEFQKELQSIKALRS